MLFPVPPKFDRGSITLPDGTILPVGSSDPTFDNWLEQLRNAGDIISAHEVVTGSLTTNELNFTPVEDTNVIAKINASSEGIVIEADNLEIRSTTTFYSGWAAAANAEADIDVLNTANAPAEAGATDDSAANAAQTTADGKIVTFYQSAVPTATDAGDFFFDTDDGKMYRATSVGDDQIIAGEWERTDVGLTPGLIDVLNTTNAPAAANADVTGSNTAADTALVSGLAASRVAGWAHGSDTTKIDGGDIYTNTIVASSIYGAGFGTLTITSGKIVINTTDALEIGGSGNVKVLNGGNITLNAGGDLIFGLSDTNPSIIKFGNVYNFGGATTTARGLCFWPTTVDVGYFRIGYDPIGAAVKNFSQVKIYAKNDIALKVETGANSGNMVLTPSFAFMEHITAGGSSYINLVGPIFTTKGTIRPILDSADAIGTTTRYYSAIYGNTHFVDAQFYLDISAGNAFINFDSTDYIAYVRATNNFNFALGNVTYLTLNNTNLVAKTHIIPLTDSLYTLGGAALCWSNIFGDAGVTSCSDPKFKVNVIKSPLGLNFINKLDPIQWEWNQTKGKKLKRKWHGFLAPDVLSVIEELGYSHDDFGGINLEDVLDDENNKIGENWGLRMDQFIGPLTSAVQELSTRLEILEAP